MKWFKKSTQPEDSGEEPPFPITKPNSCLYCERKIGRMCSVTMEAVYYSNKSGRGYRTWDRCDKYAPMHICATCKHYLPYTIVIADELVVNGDGGCARHVKCLKECCWEAKE